MTKTILPLLISLCVIPAAAGTPTTTAMLTHATEELRGMFREIDAIEEDLDRAERTENFREDHGDEIGSRYALKDAAKAKHELEQKYIEAFTRIDEVGDLVDDYVKQQASQKAARARSESAARSAEYMANAMHRINSAGSHYYSPRYSSTGVVPRVPVDKQLGNLIALWENWGKELSRRTRAAAMVRGRAIQSDEEDSRKLDRMTERLKFIAGVHTQLKEIQDGQTTERKAAQKKIDSINRSNDYLRRALNRINYGY